MKCENLQFNISIYLDDCLAADERAAVDAHLENCPLCRQQLTDFQTMRVNLRSISRAEIPNSVVASIRNRVAFATELHQPTFTILHAENFNDWLRKRLMPYTVGAAASLLFGLMLLWTLLTTAYIPERKPELAQLDAPQRSNVLLANSNSTDFTTIKDFDLNADFAAERISVSGKSPSLNPKGALVALTKSIVRGDMKDDEVVVVADVFGNGLARIAEVVEPSSDIRAVQELEKALKNDPNYAPFMPASFDRRSETVRVIFKINRVDVSTKSPDDSKSQ